MIKNITVAVLLIATFALSQTPDSQPAASASQEYQLLPDNRPKAVLSEFSLTASGKMAVTVAGKPIEVALTEKNVDKWVDEYLTPRDATDAKARRIYIDSRCTKGPRNRDSGLTGVSLIYTFKSKETSADIDNGRVLPEKVLNRLASQAGFVATDVSRSAKAKVGATVLVLVEPMLITFFDFDGTLKEVKSNFTMSSVDTKTNKALVVGTATWEEDTTVGPDINATGSYAADLSIEIDLATQLITKVDMKGKMVASGRGNSLGSVSGEVKFEGKFTAQLVKDVKSLTAAAPKFRDNHHQAHGIDFRLLSAWADLKSEDANMKKFVDSRVSSGDLYIEVNRRTEMMDLKSPTELAAFESTLKNSDPQAKAKKSSTALGPAIEFELLADARVSVQGLIVSANGKNLIMIRMTGPVAAVTKALPEFRAMTSSIKRS